MTSPAVDLAVAGGGAAGLAVAIRARQAGLSVTVLEAGRPPIDKACGEGLMPDAAALLEGLDVTIPPDRCRLLRGIRWIDGDTAVEADFPGAPGVGVRRTELHLALVRRAEAAGVDLRWGETVLGVDDGAFVTRRGPFLARWLVAADGLRSPLRRIAGLEGRRAPRRRFGLTQHYTLPPWTGHVEVHWNDAVEAYVTPLAPRQVGVTLLFEGLRPDFPSLLGRFPRLAERLGGVPVVACRRGAGPLDQRTTAVVRGNLALVGDASGSVDAITGEGLSLAFREAFAVVEAMRRESLALYAAAHRRLVRLPQALTRLLLAVERRPGLRRRVLRALARDPGLFRDLLAVHVRDRGPVPVAAWALPRLVWDLARARPARPQPAAPARST